MYILVPTGGGIKFLKTQNSAQLVLSILKTRYCTVYTDHLTEVPKVSTPVHTLKVLSSEIDLVEIRLNR
jgi:hypothetical protein